MPRAATVWIVVNADPRDFPLLGAFTVKHEMVSWLGRQIEAEELGEDSDWYIVRATDGGEPNLHSRPEHSGAPHAYEFWKENRQ